MDDLFTFQKHHTWSYIERHLYVTIQIQADRLFTKEIEEIAFFAQFQYLK